VRRIGRRDPKVVAGAGTRAETKQHRPTPQERLVRMMRRRTTRRFAYKGLKLFGVEIPATVKIGKNFQLAHGGVGVVMSQGTIIGNNVKIFQGVTLGFADEYLPMEQIPDHLLTIDRIGRVIVEDDVVVGAGAKVMFKYGQTLTVGRGAVIGANAVVLSSVPAREIWAGVPARKVSVNVFGTSEESADPSSAGGAEDPDGRVQRFLASALQIDS
jgi:serine O-acetyltransferase